VLAAEAPKITDWMQAWGSLAGLVMSTAAVIFTGLLFRHEIRVRRQEQRDSEAAQARLVIGTVTDATTAGDVVVGARWLVTNHSDAPVFNVNVSVLNRHGEGRPLVGGDSDRSIEILQPGQSEVGEVRFLYHWPAEQVNRDQMWIAAFFLDSSGVRWARGGTEVPERALDSSNFGPSFAVLLWRYLWPLSSPISWAGDRFRARKRRTEAHMRSRIFRRKRGYLPK